MSSILDHLKKIKEEQAKAAARRNGASNNVNRSIWHNWRSGDQIVRFVGDFIITKTYWLPKSNFNPIALFPESAFEGENAIPKIMNCSNWNIDEEKFEENGDVLFLLNKIARDVLKCASSLDEDTKTKFDYLKKRTDPNTYYRWNIIDRDEPTDDQGNVKEYQIASIGYELFESLLSIHDDYQPSSFTSIDEGIDIKVTKADNNGRTKYRAAPVLKRGSISVTPLTDEEKAWQINNLKEICGRQIDQDLVFSKLLPEWQDLINDYRSDVDKK